VENKAGDREQDQKHNQGGLLHGNVNGPAAAHR